MTCVYRLAAARKLLPWPTCQIDEVQHAGTAAIRRLQPHRQDAVAAAAVFVHVGACRHSVARSLLQHQLTDQAAACQTMLDVWQWKQWPSVMHARLD